MNKNKIFTFLILSIVGLPAFAQGVIYKCTDANGNVSYSSESPTGRCEKTNLAKLDNGNILNKPTTFTNNSVANSNTAPTIQNSDQVVRDQKRASILQGELSQEKTQLETVLVMISKADKTDAAQMEHLKKMEQTHKRNIASLEKELGVKNIQLANTPKGLPFNLPGTEQVEIVQPPQMSDSNYQNKVANNRSIKNNTGADPNSPYVLINPSATNRVITNNSVAAIATEPQIQIVKPEIIKEIREPAAITNKSLKKKIAPNSPMN